MAKKKSASSQQEKRVAASALFTKPLTDRQRGELDRLANLPETRIDFSDAAEATHPNSGERVRDVYFTEDTLAVDLLDGRTIIVPLTWYPAFWTQPQNSGLAGRSAARAMGFTGLT